MTMALTLVSVITQRLKAHALLLSHGVDILLQPPPSLSFPYIVIGPVQSQDWSATSVVAHSHELHLALWSRDTSLDDIALCAGAVQQVMQELPKQNESMTIGTATLLLSEMRHDSANHITSWHADYRIRTLQNKG